MGKASRPACIRHLSPVAGRPKLQEDIPTCRRKDCKPGISLGSRTSLISGSQHSSLRFCPPTRMTPIPGLAVWSIAWLVEWYVKLLPARRRPLG